MDRLQIMPLVPHEQTAVAAADPLATLVSFRLDESHCYDPIVAHHRGSERAAAAEACSAFCASRVLYDTCAWTPNKVFTITLQFHHRRCHQTTIA